MSAVIRSLLLVSFAALALTLGSCAGSGDQPVQQEAPAAAVITATPAPTEAPAGEATPSPRASTPGEVVAAAAQALLNGYLQPLQSELVFREAWEGAGATLRAAGAIDVPPPPAFPDDGAGAAAALNAAFPRLVERAAAVRLRPEDLTIGAVRAMVAQRRDCHTFYLSPEQGRGSRDALNGVTAVRLGIQIGGSPPAIINVFPGSPADRAGARRGQRIRSVNGRPVDGLSEQETVALLSRQEGAPNTIGVLDLDGRSRDLTIAAGRIPLVGHAVLPDGIALLRFDVFATPTALRVPIRTILTDLEQEGVRGWIIDLRYNGGGMFPDEIVSIFANRGQLFGEITRDGNVSHVLAGEKALPFPRPLVILVGPGTASSAEMFSGSLQALGRAVLVGAKTSGCIGRTTLTNLPDGSQIWITTRKVLIGPDDLDLNGIGLTPDIAVADGGDEIGNTADPVLDAGIQAIKQQLGIP